MKIFNEIYIYKHPERGRGYIAQWFCKSEIKGKVYINEMTDVFKTMKELKEYFDLWERKYVKMY